MKHKFKDRMPLGVYVTLRVLALYAGALAFFAPLFVEAPHARAEAFEPLILTDVATPARDAR